MRQPNNQNKRLRNRSRKGPNPLTKSFESNGPDGKIRGTALSIAEKYIQASRDSSASGDRIKAENLLQHAEHYNRIVAAAQSQLPAQQNQPREQEMEETESEAQAAAPSQSVAAPSQSVADPDSPQPTVDHSSQFANGVANGKIPNGVKIDAELGLEAKAGTSISVEGPPQGSDGQDEAPAPRRRARGRPRSGPRRPPMQPSEIVAEVARVETDQPAAEPSSSEPSDS